MLKPYPNLKAQNISIREKTIKAVCNLKKGVLHFMDLLLSTMNWSLFDWLLILGFIAGFAYLIGDFIKFIRECREGKYNGFFEKFFER